MLCIDVQGYWLAITALESQEMLMNMKIQSYAWMKKDKQDALWNSTYKKAYPTHLREDKILSSQEVAQILGTMVNG